jgi:hypothetical protein
MQSSLSDETERDVLPWLRLAEELRLLQLDMEVSVDADRCQSFRSMLSESISLISLTLHIVYFIYLLA